MMIKITVHKGVVQDVETSERGYKPHVENIYTKFLI